jgi:subtilisin family serine protease
MIKTGFHQLANKPLLIALCVVALSLASGWGGQSAGIAAAAAGSSAAQSAQQNQYGALIQKAAQAGKLEVLVTVNVAGYTPEGALAPSAKPTQRAAVRRAQTGLTAKLSAYNARLITQYEAIPVLLLETDSAAVTYLSGLPEVIGIQENRLDRVADAASNAVIGVPSVLASGYDGSNQIVVILDTGVQASHPFLRDQYGNSKIVAEACFSRTVSSSTNSVSYCPNGQSTGANGEPAQTGPGSGRNCLSTDLPCYHGTHTAGIMAGRSYSGGPGYYGVAQNVYLISLQVFSQITTSGTCSANGYPTPCALTYTSDQVAALNYIYTTLTQTYPNIAAVNMSLASALYTPPCDASEASRKAPIDNLRSLNIATIVSAGNDGITGQLRAPSCISSAFAIGATDNNDVVASFSNRANVDWFLYAPGFAIQSSFPVDAYNVLSGTSESAPHVTAAWAILRQRFPSYSVSQVYTTLRDTGVPITNGGFTRPRILLNGAAATATPSPTATVTQTPSPTATSTVPPPRPDTIGVYQAGVFYLRNSNTAGPADITVAYGPATGQLPVTGDWNGDGIDTIGVYDTATGIFSLRDSNTSGAPDYSLVFGNPGDAPLHGRWSVSATHDGVGVYRNSNGIVYLKNDLTTGFSDYYIVMGNPGDTGLAGDWNSDGVDSVGVFRPSNTRFYLSNVNGNGLTFSDLDFVFYVANAQPVAGDWNGTGQSRLGWVSTSGIVSLRYTLTDGSADVTFAFGPTSSSPLPLAGKWTGGPSPSALIGVIRPALPGVKATEPPANQFD